MEQQFFFGPGGGVEPIAISEGMVRSGGPNWLMVIGVVLAGATLIVACYNLYLTVKHRKVHEKLDDRLDQIEDED